MNRLLIAIVAMFIVSAGCQTIRLSPTADQNWLSDFDRADSIVLVHNGIRQRISDQKTIIRLATIYSNARWETYWHTLPSVLNDRTIEVCVGGNTVRRLAYTGKLWELNQHESNRIAALSAEDCSWIESLFGSVNSASFESAR